MSPESDLSAGSEILFQESKRLTSDVEVEVWIVKHLDKNCFEIFAYDPRSRRESNRLYVNPKKVRSKLNRKEVEDRASGLEVSDEVSQEAYLDQLNHVTCELSVEFLLNRLHIDTEALRASGFVLFLSTAEVGSDDPILASLSADIPAYQFIVKPEEVMPYHVERSESGPSGEDEEYNIHGRRNFTDDSFNSEDNSLGPLRAKGSSDGPKSNLQRLGQKKSFSCTNDINILWEEKSETSRALSISELIKTPSKEHGSPPQLPYSENAKHRKVAPSSSSAAGGEKRRSSFDAVHSITSRLLAPLFPESSANNGGSIKHCYSQDAGTTPKRRSTFSIFQQGTPSPFKSKPSHGENYKHSAVKLAPIDHGASPSGGIRKQPNRGTTVFSTSDATIRNSRSGSEGFLDAAAAYADDDEDGPQSPVAARKTVTKKKLSPGHIKNYSS